MTAVTDISHLAHITCPSALRDLPGWVMWRFEPNENPGGKPRKVPYYISGGRRHGQHGTADDRRQLATFDAARAAAARRRFDGVGFAPLQDFGILALDFDDCVTGGQIHPDVLALLADTYAEFSPSGNGIRAFFQGQLGDRKSLSKAGRFGMELFSTKGFVTFTGNVLDIVELMGNADEVAPISEPVLELVRTRFKREASELPTGEQNAERVGLSPSQLEHALAALPEDLPYEDDDGPSWLGVGMALHHETGGSADGFELWDTWSQRSSKYTAREYGEDRWRSFGAGGKERVTTARSLVTWANTLGAGIQLNGPATAEEFDAIAEDDTPADPAKPMRFQVIPVCDFAARPAPEWIIKGVVPRAELMVVFGESGSGKTFAVLDLVAAIARGVTWRGCRVKQGRVVYVAAEGAGGFRNRLKAYAQQHELQLGDLPMGVIADAPNLMNKPDALDVCKAIKAAGGADVVVIDTFAQAMPGANENAGEDVGKALAHCKGIHRSTGALVVLVHHAGKDASKGARGWSGLRAAADAEMEVSRGPGGRMLRVTKQKDGDDGLAWGFALDTVNVGVDGDGEAITSCQVVEAAVPTVGRTLKVMGPKEAIVNAVIQEMAQAQTSGIEVAAVITESVKRMEPPADGKRDTRKQHARRALESLCNGDDAPYWLRDDGTVEVV